MAEIEALRREEEKKFESEVKRVIIYRRKVITKLIAFWIKLRGRRSRKED